jgi:hypothetical protein
MDCNQAIIKSACITRFLTDNLVLTMVSVAADRAAIDIAIF